MPSKNPYNATGGGNWGWLIPKEIDALVILEEDPEHPEHELHKMRTSPDNPEFVQLRSDIEALGMIGMSQAKPILVYKDGDQTAVADGRRTVTAIRRDINPKRKAADRLSVRMLSTKDPELARDLNNSNRAKDPIIARARRYVAAYQVDGNKSAAAARQGFTLAEANLAEKCLSLPASIQAQINREEIAMDQALRLGKDGAKEAVAKVDAAKDKSTGRVDRERVRTVAAPRLSTRLLRGVTAEVQKMPWPDDAKALMRFLEGDRTALDAHPEAMALAKRAGWEPGKESK